MSLVKQHSVTLVEDGWDPRIVVGALVTVVQERRQATGPAVLQEYTGRVTATWDGRSIGLAIYRHTPAGPPSQHPLEEETITLPSNTATLCRISFHAQPGTFQHLSPPALPGPGEEGFCPYEHI